MLSAEVCITVTSGIGAVFVATPRSNNEPAVMAMAVTASVNAPMRSLRESFFMTGL